MSQLIINTGNVLNDGTGDPLRVAFNAVNNNFSQIWSAGLVGSNISIANNTIQVTNTNGNLNLATNGVGVIVPRAAIVPDIANVRSIGAATNRFNTVYTQYLDATMLTLSGNLYVAGNLQVTGNTVTNNYSNANIANLNIILAAGSSNAITSNNAGIIVRNANANILYNYSANSWVSTIAITAPTFKGDGANLTNVNANVDANNLLGNTLRSTILNSSLTSVGNLTSLIVTGNITSSANVVASTYTGNTVTANYLIGDGSNITNINAANVIGYIPTATFANTALVANLAALATQSINSDTALFAINANLSNYSNNAVFAQTANTATYAVQADNANSAVVAGMAYQLVSNASISVTGNLYVGNILTNGYYYANGYPFGGGGGGGTPGGANTQVQYNNFGVFAGSPAFTFDQASNTLSISNTVATTNLTSASLATTDATVYGNLSGVNANFTGNVAADTFYIGNTPFTRTLTVGRAVTPVTVPLASNNSFNVLTADGSSNVVVYTT
jgi:hypothetical protein